ncbi:MAG: outer membrane lipoprotein carrier protein LolA [Paludibacteraceae bacterium]|nr:outer membrane lipoprotein carrier protein LolA [Paludibacteraceae bacterium]
MRYPIVTILLICSTCLPAQVEIARIRSAESPFRQTRTSTMLLTPQQVTGQFGYIAPDSIAWKYQENTSIHIPQQMLQLIRQSVSGDILAIQRNFQMEWEGRKLSLRPSKKQIQRFFRLIRIEFTQDGVAKTVELFEPNGDKTEIEFTNMKYELL